MSTTDAAAPSTDTTGEGEAAQTTHTVTVHTDERTFELDVRHEATLLGALQRNGLSPFNAVSQIVNCGGQGHCGACTVDVVDGAPPEPKSILDAVLSGFDVGRLACQITVDRDMTIQV
jgi:ferredoxin